MQCALAPHRWPHLMLRLQPESTQKGSQWLRLLPGVTGNMTLCILQVSLRSTSGQ